MYVAIASDKKSFRLYEATGLEHGDICIKEVFVLEALDDRDSSLVKKDLITVLKQCDYTILKIEGGKVE